MLEHPMSPAGIVAKYRLDVRAPDVSSWDRCQVPPAREEMGEKGDGGKGREGTRTTLPSPHSNP